MSEAITPARLVEIDQLRAQIAGLNLAATQYSESRDSWCLRAKQAEADLAVLHLLAEQAVDAWSESDEPTSRDIPMVALAHALLEEHPGAALLAELTAVRAESAFLREWLRGELTIADADIDQELRKAGVS